MLQDEPPAGRVRKDKLFVKNIVLITQAPEVRETQLRELFEHYGRVLECVIPRAHDPTMSRLYGFVQFENEAEAATAQKATEGKVVFGIPLNVRFSIDMDRRSGQKPPQGLFWGESRTHSRSRSPVARPHYSLSNELKLQRDKLAVDNKGMLEKNQRLVRDIESLQAKITQTNAENDVFRRQLEQMKGVRIYLPCGHPKLIKEQEANQLEKLFEEGFERLSIEERRNGALTQKLRIKAVQILEKMHESFKCRAAVRLLFDTCGHWQETECWIKRNHEEGGKRIKCEVMTDAAVPCHEVALKY